MNAWSLRLPLSQDGFWQKVILALGQILACVFAVPFGLFASVMIAAILTLPLLLFPESLWVGVLSLCVNFLVEWGWVIGFGWLALVVRRRGARFHPYLFAALACGAVPHAIMFLLCLLTLLYIAILGVLYG